MKAEGQQTSLLISWVKHVAFVMPFQAKISSEKSIFQRIKNKFSDWTSTYRKEIFSISKKCDMSDCLRQAKNLICSFVRKLLQSKTVNQMKEAAHSLMSSHAFISLVESFKNLISSLVVHSRAIVILAALLFSLKLSFIIIHILQQALWLTVSAVSLCSVFFIISVLVCLSLQNFLKGLKDKKHTPNEDLMHWSKLDLDNTYPSLQYVEVVADVFTPVEILQEENEGLSHQIDVSIDIENGFIEVDGGAVDFILKNGGWRVCQQIIGALKESGGFHLGSVMESIKHVYLSDSNKIVLLIDPSELEEADQELLEKIIKDVFLTWTNSSTARQSYFGFPFPF